MGANAKLFSILDDFALNEIHIYLCRRYHNFESACLIAGCAFGVFTMLSTALNTAMVTSRLALLPLLTAVLLRKRRVKLDAEITNPLHPRTVP